MSYIDYILAFVLLFSLLMTLYINFQLLRRIKKFKQREKKNAAFLEQINRSQKMESIGRLAGGVAHDFNNMLAGINGAAEVLKSKLDDKSPLMKYADVIINTCLKASNLTSQLLMFSRSKGLASDNMNLHKCLEESIFLLEHGISKDIRIKKNLRAENFYIKGSYDLIQNMILNLGFNSRDAMPKGGTIALSTKNVYLEEKQIRSAIQKVEPGEYIEIIFKDTGVGIAENIKYKVFEPFFTTKEIGKGSGLGLPAVYGIVTENGGTIKVKSSAKGTSFIIYFPVVEMKKAAKVKERKAGKLKAKVLAVDDDKVLLKILRDILESIGAEAVTVSNPFDVVQIYKAHSDIDAVMLDVIMPDKSGAELYGDLKKLNPNIKVVFMSGYNKDSAIENILRNEDGAVFLNKPYRIADVVDKLKFVLAKN